MHISSERFCSPGPSRPSISALAVYCFPAARIETGFACYCLAHYPRNEMKQERAPGRNARHFFFHILFFVACVFRLRKKTKKLTTNNKQQTAADSPRPYSGNIAAISHFHREWQTKEEERCCTEMQSFAHFLPPPDNGCVCGSTWKVSSSSFAADVYDPSYCRAGHWFPLHSDKRKALWERDGQRRRRRRSSKKIRRRSIK